VTLWKGTKLVIGIMGVPAFSIIFVFAWLNPEVTNNWFFIPLGIIVVFSIIITILGE
jgi:hypothetical protein